MSTEPTPQTAAERNLLDAARRGDETAFARLVAPYRAELHAHSYQMLGSVHDAEDALQDALLRAWRGLDRFEGRSSLRTWLHTIATNASLRTIERRPKRVLPIDGGPPGDPSRRPVGALVESSWVEPYPAEQLGLLSGYASPHARFDRHESVELAFIALLQHLPPRQRAVLILRDVLGFSAREVAEMLEATPASIDSLLQRAHAAVAERLPAQSQQASLRVLGDDAIRRLVDRFVEAWERGDVDAVVALLTEDATIAMPPFPTWFDGREAVATFLRAWPLAPGGRRTLVATNANGQIAFGQYVWSEADGRYDAHAIDVLTLRGERIADIIAFLDPALFERFGLPPALDRPAHGPAASRRSNGALGADQRRQARSSSRPKEPTG